jgi:hypothetical protein
LSPAKSATRRLKKAPTRKRKYATSTWAAAKVTGGAPVAAELFSARGTAPKSSRLKTAHAAWAAASDRAKALGGAGPQRHPSQGSPPRPAGAAVEGHVFFAHAAWAASRRRHSTSVAFPLPPPLLVSRHAPALLLLLLCLLSLLLLLLLLLLSLLLLLMSLLLSLLLMLSLLLSLLLLLLSLLLLLLLAVFVGRARAQGQGRRCTGSPAAFATKSWCSESSGARCRP